MTAEVTVVVKFYNPPKQPKEWDFDAFLAAAPVGGRHVHRYDVRSNDTGNLIGGGFLSLDSAYNWAHNPHDNPSQSESEYTYEETYTKTPAGHIWEDDFGHIPEPERAYSLLDVAQNGNWIARNLVAADAVQVAENAMAAHEAAIVNAFESARTDAEYTETFLDYMREPTKLTANVATVKLVDPATGTRSAEPPINAMHGPACSCDRCRRHQHRMNVARRYQYKRLLNCVDVRYYQGTPAVVPMPFAHDFGTTGVATRQFSSAESAVYIPAMLKRSLALLHVAGPEILVVEIGTKSQLMNTLRKISPRKQMQYRVVKYAEIETVRADANRAVITKKTGRVVYRGTVAQIMQWAGEKVRKYHFNLDDYAIIKVVPLSVKESQQRDVETYYETCAKVEDIA